MTREHMIQQTSTSNTILHIGIVGAGAMGRGIAQIAAQAGLMVHLHDVKEQAVEAAFQHLRSTLERLAEKGKITASDVEATLSHIHLSTDLSALAQCDLVVEAIVENLEVKRGLVAQLEAILSDNAIIASNTSSLSITAIAAGARIPGRIAGYHFFNPVPLMKVVEVVDGLSTAAETGDRLMTLATTMGHMPVRCKDMPGFIVNHAGRGMNIEGLKVAQEGVADFADIDAIMREQAGFRMGPFELMDLTGLDVSHPVMESIYQQFYQEARYRPSPITAVRAVGGILGRKTAQGFYAYPDGNKLVAPERSAPAARPRSVWVSQANAHGHAMTVDLLAKLGVQAETSDRPSQDALILVTPLGMDASTAAINEGLDATRVVAIDTLLALSSTKRRTLMATPLTSEAFKDAAHGLLSSDGVPVTVIRDSAGFVAQRILCSIINIACDIAQQRIATPNDIDQAVHLGLGYPKGPLALGDAIGAPLILETLRALHELTGDMRYRPSPWLWRRAGLGASLLHTEF